MPKIEFAEQYPKLYGQTSAKLVSVQVLYPRDFTTELLEYDTKNIHGKYYPIDTTKTHIQLVFVGNLGIPFCTLRKYKREKLDWYRDLIGDIFDVVVTHIPVAYLDRLVIDRNGQTTLL